VYTGRVVSPAHGEETTQEAWTVQRSAAKAKKVKTIDAQRTAAIEHLFHLHYGSLLRSLSLVALDRQIADDAVQEAFFKLYQEWDRISQYRDPAAWLYRVAVCRCRDQQRGIARAKRLLERIVTAKPPEDSGWSVEPALLRAFRALPHRQRVAASLHYIAGLSLLEVAEAMNISEGTAKTHLFRARQRLRAELEERE
jgi:RNA polymerase sigma-70 factor (ECF subfamily)